MAPLPVIANCFRCTLEWNNVNGVAPVNVFHVRSDSESVPDIGDSVAAGLIAGEAMFCPMPDEYVNPTLSILPLDGTSATYVHGPVTGLNGAGDEDFAPALAAIASFRTAQRGPRGRGRMYVGPVAETSQTKGRLVGDALTNFPAGVANFIAQLVTEDTQLVVASYVHAEYNLVLSGTGETILGTQRRRQTQLRG